jgi:hypothetical protein
MDTLRVIPQVFFDLIARVVPGMVGILLFGAALRLNWQIVFSTLKEGPTVFNESTTLWVLALFVLSYVLGHILSPLGKVLQKLNDPFDAGVIKPLFADRPDASREVVAFVKDQLGNPFSYERYFEKDVWLWYDWLRVFVPGAGALAARIRAEYTMYSTLSVAFAIAFFIRLALAIRTFEPRFDVTFLVATGVIAGLMFFRWRDTDLTFRQSVRNFYFVARARFDPRWQVSSRSFDS